MQFMDMANDEHGQPRKGFPVGAYFISEDGAWRLIASDPNRPNWSEWEVWQHVEPSRPLSEERTWRRRVPWVRMRHPEEAQVIAVALAALPANASWEVARVVLRDALRTAGRLAFLRSFRSVTTMVARLAAKFKERAATGDVDEDPQDAGV